MNWNSEKVGSSELVGDSGDGLREVLKTSTLQKSIEHGQFIKVRVSSKRYEWRAGKVTGKTLSNTERLGEGISSCLQSPLLLVRETIAKPADLRKLVADLEAAQRRNLESLSSGEPSLSLSYCGGLVAP